MTYETAPRHNQNQTPFSLQVISAKIYLFLFSNKTYNSDPFAFVSDNMSIAMKLFSVSQQKKVVYMNVL